MADDSGQERTEQATPKRRQEAKKKGQVPRSRELNTMAMLIAASGSMLVMGGGLVEQLGNLLIQSLTIDRALLFNDAALPQMLQNAIVDGLVMSIPFFIIMIIAAIGASIALGGWSFSLEAMSFKIDKLNPIKGMKRLFAVRGLVELAKALAKFILIGGITVILLQSLAGEFLGLGYETVNNALAHTGNLLSWAFLALTMSLILIAAVDVPFQLWDHSRQIKMTHQQIKDEHKDTEGKPEVKGRIRNLQREMAQRRMMEEVPQADVVVTNPTHFAVALRYEAGSMGAPRVVAKGTDLVAAQIRNVALGSGVPLLPAPPLARALYYTTELDQEIPAGLYLAVAQVLAYVYQVRTANDEGASPPPVPDDLPVPPELYSDERGYRN